MKVRCTGWREDLFKRSRVEDVSCGLVKARMANGIEDIVRGRNMVKARWNAVLYGLR